MRLDALRGCFLILMAAIHVPTPVSHALQDPLGYNGAAEGFIFLSACLAGLVYGKSYLHAGWPEMSRRVWKRTLRIYLIHLGVLIPTALVAWAFAGQVIPLANHFHDFLLQPRRGLALMPVLLDQPPLFDILPLYVVFLGLTPFMFVIARRYGWGIVLAASALVWLAVQTKLEARILGNLLQPFQLGSFNLLGWQFLWVCGAAIGETSVRRQVVARQFRAGLIPPALAIIFLGFFTRHGFWPQAWWNPDIYLWMDKWTLGPLRLLNFAAWSALFLAWNPHPSPRLMAAPALLGRHSLAVFAFHLPLVIAATTVIQVFTLSDAMQTVLGILLIALLFGWAAWLDRNNRRPGHTIKRQLNVPFKTPFPPGQATGETAGR